MRLCPYLHFTDTWLACAKQLFVHLFHMLCRLFRSHLYFGTPVLLDMVGPKKYELKIIKYFHIKMVNKNMWIHMYIFYWLRYERRIQSTEMAFYLLGILTRERMHLHGRKRWKTFKNDEKSTFSIMPTRGSYKTLEEKWRKKHEPLVCMMKKVLFSWFLYVFYHALAGQNTQHLP